MMPEDFPGGVKEMISSNGKGGDPYEDLVPLAKRRTTEIKLKSGGGADEAEMAMKYGYSQPITQVSRLAQKMYGYQRDANLTSHLERIAVKGTNALNDFILAAPCANRDGRFADEALRIEQWEKVLVGETVGATDEEDDEEGKSVADPMLEQLLTAWGKADAVILQAQIIEDQDGIAVASKLNDQFRDAKAKRDQAEMEAAHSLKPAEYQIFWCRVRQLKIMRERAYDLAMGYPTEDFTDVKRKIAEGQNIHDLVQDMPWPFKESYLLCAASMSDGTAHREMIMAMIAGQLPAQQQPMWPMQPGYYPGTLPDGMDGQDDEQDGQEKRKAIFGISLGGNKSGAQQPPQNNSMRRRNARRRRPR